MYNSVNAVTGIVTADSMTLVEEVNTMTLLEEVLGQAPSLAYMVVVRPEVGIGMGIWFTLDSHPDAHSWRGRK